MVIAICQIVRPAAYVPMAVAKRQSVYPFATVMDHSEMILIVQCAHRTAPAQLVKSAQEEEELLAA